MQESLTEHKKKKIEMSKPKKEDKEPISNQRYSYNPFRLCTL